MATASRACGGQLGALRAELLRRVPASALADGPANAGPAGQCTGRTGVDARPRDIVRAYPNVASIDLSVIRRTIGEISRRATLAIRF